MAFNPFRRMRKHQKTIMAALVMLSMVTFVLMGSNFGGGDFFSNLAHTFTGTARATDVANLYGKEVTGQQLQRVRKQREIAHYYMQRATEIAANHRVEAIRKTLGKGPQAQQALVQHVRSDPDLNQLGDRLRSGKEGRPYFGGDISTEGILDFLIWKHQADRLGIYLQELDVNVEVTRLTLNLFTQDDSRTLVREMMRDPQFKNFWSEGILIASLTDEFRVRMAQNVLTGYEPGSIDRVAAPVTPAEFWNFYKDNRTSVEVGLLPVRVEDFVSQVKEKPTEEELKELYTKYKDRAYNPESPEPGFKRPQRIRVEWLGAGADLPYYKQLAADSAPLIETVPHLLAAFGGPVATGSNLALARKLDERLNRKYEELKWRQYRNASLSDFYWFAPYPMHKSSFREPGDVAAWLGQSLALAGTPAASLSAISTAEGLAIRREITQRLLFDMTLSLFRGPQPSPLAAAALTVHGTPQHEFLPLEEVKDELREKIAADQTHQVRNFVIKTVKDEIDQLAKKDKKSVAKYVAETAKKYHLHLGQTTGLRGEYEDPIANDPGMAPLLAAYVRPPSDHPNGKGFGELFFPPPRFGMEQPWETYSVKQWPDGFLAESADTVFLYWKTEDQPAKIVPLSDPAVRQQVERAWRFRKARELVQKEAEQLAAQVRQEKGDRRKLEDLAAKRKTTLIQLPPLAKLDRQQTMGGNSAYEYVRPYIPEDRLPHVQAPDPFGLGSLGRNRSSPFADKLVNLGDKPVGDTLVLPDLPETTYYVAVLLQKFEPTWNEFYHVYQDSSSTAFRKDPLMGLFEEERQFKYRMDFLTRLREDAKLDIHGEAAKRMDGQGGAE